MHTCGARLVAWMAASCGGCACLGIAATSLVPARRFQTLVLSLFPPAKKLGPKHEAEAFALDPVALGKVKKLCEYAERNAHRVNEMAHNLASRLAGFLANKQVAHARTAVAALDGLGVTCVDALGAFGAIALGALRMCVEYTDAVLAAEAMAAAAHYFESFKANQLRTHVEEWGAPLCAIAEWERSKARRHPPQRQTTHNLFLSSARRPFFSFFFNRRNAKQRAQKKVERELAILTAGALTKAAAEPNWALRVLGAVYDDANPIWVLRANALEALLALAGYRVRTGVLDAQYAEAAAKAAAHCIMDVSHAPSTSPTGVAIAAFTAMSGRQEPGEAAGAAATAMSNALRVLEVVSAAAQDASTARAIAHVTASCFSERGAFGDDCASTARSAAIDACERLRTSLAEAGQAHQMQLALLNLAAKDKMLSGLGRGRVLGLARSASTQILTAHAATAALGIALRELPGQLVAQQSLGWGAVKDLVHRRTTNSMIKTPEDGEEGDDDEQINLSDALEMTIAALAARCTAEARVETSLAALRSACHNATAKSHERTVLATSLASAAAMVLSDKETIHGLPEPVLLSCVELGLHPLRVCRSAALRFIAALTRGALRPTEEQRLQLMSLVFHEAGVADPTVDDPQLTAAALLEGSGEALAESATLLAATLVVRGCESSNAPSLCVGLGVLLSVAKHADVPIAEEIAMDCARAASLRVSDTGVVTLPLGGNASAATDAAGTWCRDKFGAGARARKAIAAAATSGAARSGSAGVLTEWIGGIVTSPAKLARIGLGMVDDEISYVPMQAVTDALDAKQLKEAVHAAVAGSGNNDAESEFTTGVFAAALDGGEVLSRGADVAEISLEGVPRLVEVAA